MGWRAGPLPAFTRKRKLGLMNVSHRLLLTFSGLALLLAAPAAAHADDALAERELTVHGFRSPSMGVELRDHALGFHVGLFPLIADDGLDGSRTTWFLKTGLTVYPVRFALGSRRPSGPFASVSLLQGLNNRSIAAALVLSPRTVENHISRLLAKTGCQSRTQLLLWAQAER
jgi:hypothetical protein